MESPSSDSECPSDEAIEDFVGATSAPAMRKRIRAHMLRCERCRDLVVSLARGTGAVDDPVVAPPQAGRYQLGAVLGMGAMGVVYAAHDPELGRAVAIKLLRDSIDRPSDDSRAAAERRQRLQRESQLLARVEHPYVVSVYDVGESSGRLFVAMELVEGGTLRDWMGQAEHTVPAVLEMFVKVSQGLLAVHRAGLVHRDFKPENVLLGGDGRPRVTDFGLARGAFEPSNGIVSNVSSPTEHSLAMTATGALLGTPAYMAPEQLRGQRVTAAADVFAFAVVMWEAMVGVRPFLGINVTSLSEAIETQRIQGTGTRRVPRPLRRLLGRCLQLDPNERPSMQTLVAELERLAHPTPSRLRWGAAAAVALTALTALLGWHLHSVAARASCQARPYAARFPGTGRQPFYERLMAARGEDAARFLIETIDARFEHLNTTRVRACEEQLTGSTQQARDFASRRECLDRIEAELDHSLLELDRNPGFANAERILDDMDEAAVCMAPAVSAASALSVRVDAATAQTLARADVAARFERCDEALPLYAALLLAPSPGPPPATTTIARAKLGEGRCLLGSGQSRLGHELLAEAKTAALLASDVRTALAALVLQFDDRVRRKLDDRRTHRLFEEIEGLWRFFRGDPRFGTALAQLPQAVARRAALLREAGRLLDAEIAGRSAVALESDPLRRRRYEIDVAGVVAERGDLEGAMRLVVTACDDLKHRASGSVWQVRCEKTRAELAQRLEAFR